MQDTYENRLTNLAAYGLLPKGLSDVTSLHWLGDSKLDHSQKPSIALNAYSQKN